MTMSKFSFSITKPDVADKIYSEVVDKSECLQKKLDNGFVITLIFKDAARYPFSDCVLLGYAVDHRNNRVIMDPAYLIQGLYDFEGVFTAIKLLGDQVEVFSDLFGMSAVCYSSGDEYFIASDSVSDIAKIRQIAGFGSFLNEEEVLSRSWVNSITNQILSPITPLEGIYYRVPGQILRVSVAHGYAQPLLKTSVIYQEFLSSPVGSYVDELRQGVKEMVGVVSGISGAGYGINCDLSGGMDSRLVLALVRYSSFGEVAVNSSRAAHMARDFDIANKLSEIYGFDLNPKRASGSFFKNDPLNLWFSSNAGLNDSLYFQKITSTVISFKAGGFGAAIYKGGYGFRRLDDIGRSRLSSGKYDLFQKYLRYGLEAAGFDADHSIGSELHYLFYRNPIHGGSVGPTSLYFLRPLNNRRLANLAFSDKNIYPSPKASMPSILHDLMICLDPLLATESYDKPGKQISRSFASSRYKVIGGVGPINPYSVMDFSFKLSPGASSTSLNWSKEKCFTGDSFDTVSRLFYDAPVTGLLMRDNDFCEVFRMAKNELSKDFSGGTSKGRVALGKVLSLNLSS